MKSIFKIALGTVLGNFISQIILIFLICIFMIFNFILTSKNIFKFNKNSIIEINASSLNNAKEEDYQKIIQGINLAKLDKNIKGIALELNDLHGDITYLDNIRNTLQNFKKSNKFIYSYADKYSQSAYYISSISDIIFLHPLGNIDFKGLFVENLFYKKLTNKLGITFNAYKYSNYKSAPEPYTKYKMSNENKKQIFRILNIIWNDLLIKIGKSRNITKNQLNKIADNLLAMLPNFSYNHKLVDKLASHEEFINFIKQKINYNINKKLPKISIIDYINNYKNYLSSQSINNIALFYAHGSIIQGNQNFEIQDLNYKNIIDNINNDKSIKAVVLHINSPGGDVIASDNIYRYLLKLKKPLIISLGEQAASGAYYIALAGNTIIASPYTITGSIGVFALYPNINIISKKLGIHVDHVCTNKNSNIYSLFYGINNKYKNIIMHNIKNIYIHFMNQVSIRRNLSINKVKNIAQGKIWIGKEAIKNGLIDNIGDINYAIKIAAKKAKINNYNIIEISNKQRFSSNFKDKSKEEIKNLLKYEIFKLFNIDINYLMDINNIKNLFKLKFLIKNDVKITW